MARSLKTSYLLLALGVSAVLALLLGGLAYYEHRITTSDANQLTYATVEESVEPDSKARAPSLSNIASSSLAAALKEGNNPGVAAIAARLLDERDIERVEIWGPHNEILYSGSNPNARPTTSGPFVLRTELPHGGSLEIWMSRAEMQETLSSIRTQLISKQGVQGKRIRGVFTVVTVPLFILGLLGALFFARRLSGPIAALVKSADRIGDGDYTRPLAVVRSDELGDLQFALERMRQNLNETTITKNYLNTVLNSLSDAVFVTTPDGVVKSCNEAAQLLLGYSSDELVGKPLLGFIDEVHRSAFDPTHSSTEARETVLRTASGQTIPVSMASSAIDSQDPQFQGNIYVDRKSTRLNYSHPSI